MKSPRGKSPRSSTKKKAVRRLMLDALSPRKFKLETSKRALFQSPPMDAGPSSKLLGSSNTNTHKIKRVLFPTSQKNEGESEDMKATPLREESRKRKSEEELEGPPLKWPKSLSFDCTHEFPKARITWDRHSSSTILSKNETSFNQERNELSDTHRKVIVIVVILIVHFELIAYLIMSNADLRISIFRSYSGRSRRLYEAKASA